MWVFYNKYFVYFFFIDFTGFVALDVKILYVGFFFFGIDLIDIQTSE
jgi:hypothetical protein